MLKGTCRHRLGLGVGTPFGRQQGLRRAADIAEEELRTIGLSVTVQERILADFRAVS